MNENNTQNISQDNAVVTQKANGLGIAGMVIGIISILLSCIVFGGYIGIVGLILSIIAVVQKNKKKGMAIAGIVLNAVAIIIMVIVLASASAVSDSINGAISSSVTPSESAEMTKESTEPVSPPSSEEDTTDVAVNEASDDKCRVGDVWQNKYVSVSFDECGEYVSDNQFIQPADGNKYIYATFTFENVGSSDTTITCWDFDCYADGYACEATYGADDAGFSQTLSVGRKIAGTVYFEVPENATEIEIEFSPNFWTSEKVVFLYQ